MLIKLSDYSTVISIKNMDALLPPSKSFESFVCVSFKGSKNSNFFHNICFCCNAFPLKNYNTYIHTSIFKNRSKPICSIMALLFTCKEFL